MNQANEYIGKALSGYAGGAALLGGEMTRAQSQQPQPVRDKPLMDVEYDHLEQAILELDQSVQWLLQRIQPVCQPATGAIGSGQSNAPDAPESHMRTKLKNLRGIIESISGRISEVRYTIEI